MSPEVNSYMKETSPIRTVNITRYVTPLREGGSLPAIVEADDEFLYALKFRGAGQGVKALVAELLGGEIARALGLRVPEIVFAQVDPAFGRT
ncbi:MAG TPA: HipA family kinase, partial [Flavisolibacter sp.]|nr:HipA family kinase [Flavisolibacter sp.]